MWRVNRLCRLAIPAAAISLVAVGTVAAPARSVPPPPPSAVTSFTIPGVLYGVATISASNAWAVGYTGTTPVMTLILHWNGRQWSQVTSPKPVNGELYAVTAVSADNAWAVGETESSAPLIMHWNGKAWSQQTAIPAVSGELNAVTVTGNTVWAAGETDDLLSPYFLDRVGGIWSLVPVQVPANSAFFSFAVTDRNTVWAVGGSTIKGKYYGLVVRWSGNVWKSVSSPLEGAGNGLLGVAAGAAGALWAVGADYRVNLTDPTATSMLWNGKNWRKVPVGPFAPESALLGVTFVPGGTAWAVGWTGTGSLILRWTGRAWTQVANPDAEKYGGLLHVAATSASNAWAVGNAYSGDQQDTLILHWNGKTWS